MDFDEITKTLSNLTNIELIKKWLPVEDENATSND